MEKPGTRRAAVIRVETKCFFYMLKKCSRKLPSVFHKSHSEYTLHFHKNCGTVERCKHVKSQATTVYFRLGKLRRVYTYVQHMWGIIGHVTVEAGNTVGTDGAPPQT